MILDELMRVVESEDATRSAKDRKHAADLEDSSDSLPAARRIIPPIFRRKLKVGVARCLGIRAGDLIARNMHQEVLEPCAVHGGWVDEELLSSRCRARAGQHSMIDAGLELAENRDEVEQKLNGS